jgi:hypothetical protein
MSGAKNASDLVPAGGIYGLGRNKSVELTIPGGAIGGPVSILRWYLATRLINLDDPTRIASRSLAWTFVRGCTQCWKFLVQL